MHVDLVEGWLESVARLEGIPARGEHPSRLDAFYEQHQNYMRGCFYVGKPMPIFDVLDNTVRLEQFHEQMVLTPAAYTRVLAQAVPRSPEVDTFLRFWHKNRPFPHQLVDASTEKGANDPNTPHLNSVNNTTAHYHLAIPLLPEAKT